MLDLEQFCKDKFPIIKKDWKGSSTSIDNLIMALEVAVKRITELEAALKKSDQKNPTEVTI